MTTGRDELYGVPMNLHFLIHARWHRQLAVCCALMLAGLAACRPAASTAPPEAAIEIGDTAITAPATLPAGLVAITFTTTRTTPSDGVPLLARLHDGVTLDEALAEDADPTSAPKKVLLGGHLGRSIFDLAAGSYMVQWASPSDTGNPPPVSFTVQGETMSRPPIANVTLALNEWTFTVPDSVPRGKQLWQITNRGALGHHALCWKLNAGATDEQFTAWAMQPEPQGQPPAALVADWAPTDADVTSWAELDLSAGTYYLVCLLPDFSTDPPQSHLAHGMIRTFRVQ